MLSCSKTVSEILREATSNNNDDFYCLDCLHTFRTKNKRKHHKKVCENKDLCNFIMPSEDTNIGS